MRGKTIKICLLLPLLALCACIFHPQHMQSVIGYRSDGRVFITKNSFYYVGILPDGWQRMDTRAKTISFYNPQLKSSISTDAFCGRDVSNRKLNVLAGEIVSAVEGRSVVSETNFDLDGRGALRQKVKGTMDGVPVRVDIVVVKKDYCVFDMYLVATGDADTSVDKDFEAFFEGFHYGSER